MTHMLLLSASLLSNALISKGHASPIINGAEEDGFPSAVAIGAIFGDNAFSACTGNLITPKIVLTAAHCGAEVPLDIVVSMGLAFFGTEVTDPDHTMGFVDLQVHPDYEELDGWDMGANDVAVLVLQDVAPVEPTWFRRTEVSEDEIGNPLMSVGFGIRNTSTQASGVKHSVEFALSDLDEMFLIVDSPASTDGQICSGDSGGPQFFTDLHEEGRWVQGAIHSWGDQNCEWQSGSTRTDLVADWILDQIEAVHGSRDVCEINGWYGDGICDPYCDEPDGDCIDFSADTGEPLVMDDGDGRACACSSGPSGGATGWVALMGLLIGWRRRGDVRVYPVLAGPCLGHQNAHGQ
jgi:MYXO-CTERM domain-containing protein